MVGDYWGWYGGRSYHHTGMVSTWCAPVPGRMHHVSRALKKENRS